MSIQQIESLARKAGATTHRAATQARARACWQAAQTEADPRRAFALLDTMLECLIQISADFSEIGLTREAFCRFAWLTELHRAVQHNVIVLIDPDRDASLAIAAVDHCLRRSQVSYNHDELGITEAEVAEVLRSYCD